MLVTRSWIGSGTTSAPIPNYLSLAMVANHWIECLSNGEASVSDGEQARVVGCGNIEETCGRLQFVNADLSIALPNCDVASMFLHFTTVHTDSPAFIAVSGMFAGSLESLSWGRLRGV